MYVLYIKLLCPQVDPEQWDANVGEIFYLMLLLLAVNVIIDHYYYCLFTVIIVERGQRILNFYRYKLCDILTLIMFVPFFFVKANQDPQPCGKVIQRLIWPRGCSDTIQNQITEKIISGTDSKFLNGVGSIAMEKNGYFIIFDQSCYVYTCTRGGKNLLQPLLGERGYLFYLVRYLSE